MKQTDELYCVFVASIDKSRISHKVTVGQSTVRRAVVDSNIGVLEYSNVRILKVSFIIIIIMEKTEAGLKGLYIRGIKTI